MKNTAINLFKLHLKSGHVYRREELAHFTLSVDRHLKTLTDEGILKKLQNGLYHCPEKFEFGDAPANENILVSAFLRSEHYLLTSPNDYNMLGLGTTQLYNLRIVYNQKRHGDFVLGGRKFLFQRRLNVPKKVTEEFLLVDLVNELDRLAEDQEEVLKKCKVKAVQMDQKKLSKAVSLYGNYSTRKWFQAVLSHD